MLESQEVFSYPRLAASYRFGYGALRKEKFMVSRLQPGEPDYRKLFVGDMARFLLLLSRRMGAKSRVSEGNGEPSLFCLPLSRPT